MPGRCRTRVRSGSASAAAGCSPARRARGGARPLPLRPCRGDTTGGGGIVSFVYRPGSVGVADVQRRPDVVTCTTGPLDGDHGVVGPLRCGLHASSSAVDTDFAVRLSDVVPDGRVIRLQYGVLRARYRDLDGEPRPPVPARQEILRDARHPSHLPLPVGAGHQAVM